MQAAVLALRRTSRRASSSRCRSAHGRRASACDQSPTRSSASRCRSRSRRSVSGTRLLADHRRRSAAAPGRARPRAPPALIPSSPAGVPLAGGGSNDYDALIEGIGDARVVLLGEATSRHARVLSGARGHHEASDYRRRDSPRWRSKPTGPTLIGSIATCAATGPDEDAVEALAGFGRFPTWMWRNADVLDFVGWLRAHNEAQPAERRAGFYGLTYTASAPPWRPCWSIWTKSIRRPRGAPARRYACFDHFGEEMQATATRRPPASPVVRGRGGRRTARAAAAARGVRQPGRTRRRRRFLLRGTERAARPERRRVLPHDVPRSRGSWNLRDRHMADTSRSCSTFLERSRPGARLVVWAHNSHLGDARATEWASRRAERRTTAARALRRDGRRGLHDPHGDGHGGIGMGWPGGAQARAAGAGRQLRAAVPRGGHPAVPAAAAQRSGLAPRSQRRSSSGPSA